MLALQPFFQQKDNNGGIGHHSGGSVRETSL